MIHDDIPSYDTEVGDDRGEALDRFEAALAGLPQPGVGAGYHGAILGAANLGVYAGVEPDEIARAIRAHTRPGGRKVPDGEIADAVRKAVREATGATPRIPGHLASPPVWLDGDAAFEAVRRQGAGATEEAIRAASPVTIPADPGEQAVVLLRTLYAPEDVLFLGERHDTAVAPVREWIQEFRAGLEVPPHVIPNPLTGRTGMTKAGKPSMRADSCVAGFRFAVAEFDERPRDAQIEFWAGADLPVAALIDSGGKSIHAWIRVDGVSDATAWELRVEAGLFLRWLVPLGCDRACRNESRLSRLPGHLRTDTERFQRSLYLAPDGRRVAT